MDAPKPKTTMTLENEHGKYSVTVNEDHLNLDGVIQRLLEPLLLAASYSEKTISDYFKEWGQD